ncbi:MAG: penicillin-binding protein, partial [Prevotella sp.]|nr:penicillin-binding protein [Prevotella sp.]
HLVCCTWVGGEYRAIHFRTGQLGQGSRTALPVCGLFYKSVLSDPQFSHYHGKFAPPHDKSITSSMYQCATYFSEPVDSLNTDNPDSDEGTEEPTDEPVIPIEDGKLQQ